MKKETAKEFITRLKSLSNLDISDAKVITNFGSRLKKVIYPEIEKQNSLQAKSISRAFTKVVY